MLWVEGFGLRVSSCTSTTTAFPFGVFALAALAGDAAFSFLAAGSRDRRFFAAGFPGAGETSAAFWVLGDRVYCLLFMV